MVGKGVVGDSVGLIVGLEVGICTGDPVGCGSVGEIVGAGLAVGDRVPANGAGEGAMVGLGVFGMITPFLQSAWLKHSSSPGHSTWNPEKHCL